MRRKFPILKVFWNCGCGACHCLNFFLALVALHLTLWIMLDSMGKVIPLPDILTRWAVHKSLGPEYSANWGRAVFDLRGGLYLEKIHVLKKETGDTILTAGSARVNWAVFHVLTDIFPPIDELEASQISFYLPAGYAPSGLNEPVVAIKNLSLEEEHGILVVHDLQLQSGGIHVNLTGKGSLEKPGNSLESEGQSDWLPRVYLAIASLQRQSPDLKAILNVDWDRPVGGDHHFKLRFILPSLKTGVADLEKITGFAALAGSSSSIRYYRMEASGYLAGLNKSMQDQFAPGTAISDPILFQLNATGKPVGMGTIPLPSDLDIVFSSPGKPFQFFDLASFSTSLNAEVPVVKGILTGPHLFVSGSAIPITPGKLELLQFLKNPIRADFTARLDNASLAYFFPEYPKVRLLEGTGARSLRFEASFFSDPFAIEGTLFADAIHIGATDFSNLHADLLVDREHLSLSRAHVQVSRGESARGAYTQHFPSSSFSLLARGSIFPETLDSLLGKWWKNIFTHIRVDQPAHGDVSVWGQWRDNTSLQSITDAHGEGACYRDYPIPRLKVRVRSNYDWVMLSRFEGNFDDHRILGNINWRQVHDPDERRPMELEFKSNAPWGAVVAASGISLLERFKVGGNPLVEANGIVWNPPKNNKELGAIPDLRIRLNTFEEAFDTGNLLLSDLNLEGHVGEDLLQLNSVSGTFAQGIFTGSVDVANWSVPDNMSRHLKLQLFDADYREAVSKLTGLLKNPEGIREALLRNTTRGRADADLNLLLKHDAMLSSGRGHVTLRQADIGQIHMLGGLSRALNGMGLGFSSLDLNAASMEWKLDDGIFRIPKCLLTGPVLNLDINGDIDLPKQQIALQANVMLFRGLIGQVFAPVGDSFQFDLSGPLDNPTWQVRLNPFRWFQNRLSPDPKRSAL